jgi:sensor histidine kinase YesM
VAKGNLEIPLLEVQSQDEIGVVTGAFNQMVVNLRQYIERIRRSMELERTMKEHELRMEAHLKDAQLKYLQAQINPHFLFNTLNAGAQLAMMEGADRTYEYVQNVAELFRYNVRKGKEIVSLREEIELVDNYIYILNVRFSGDIHYEKIVDPSLLEVQMPSMILQPIVENSVNHGIREMAGEGKIWLQVYAQMDLVCVSIRDNGAGMSSEIIEKVLDGSYQEEGAASNGIGMDNVIARLRLFMGCEDVMSIQSPGKDQGTEVVLYLQNKERGETDVQDYAGG